MMTTGAQLSPTEFSIACVAILDEWLQQQPKTNTPEQDLAALRARLWPAPFYCSRPGCDYYGP
jgi:hypothetical protein